MKKINRAFSTKICASLILIIVLVQISCSPKNSTENYKGTIYHDEQYTQGVQKLPGKLQCEYYDLGGEGVAYHDSDSINSGSGGLNKADGTYLHEFRIKEAVDISYTKFGDPPTDNSAYNLVEPKPNQLYVGWTEPGEWIKYTVEVEQSGTYTLGLMYTANRDAKIALAVNDILRDTIDVPSTYVEADTIAWRQWHHWNYLDDMTRLALNKGSQTITIHTVATGNMNYDFINFELVD